MNVHFTFVYVQLQWMFNFTFVYAQLQWTFNFTFVYKLFVSVRNSLVFLNINNYICEFCPVNILSLLTFSKWCATFILVCINDLTHVRTFLYHIKIHIYNWISIIVLLCYCIVVLLYYCISIILCIYYVKTL